MRGLIKKMLEEHEKTKIKAPRSTSKRNEKTRSKSNTKETAAEKETAVPTGEFETGSSCACLPFLQVVRDSRDIKNCTNNCLDSKTGAQKGPARNGDDGLRLRTPLPTNYPSLNIIIKKVKEMPV